MKKVVLTLGMLVALMLCFATANAADSTQIAQAVNKGMTWLAAQQNPDGSWGSSYTVGYTGLCVKKFEHHAVHSVPAINPLNPAYQYYNQVKKGLNYLFSKACTVPISPQPAGNPDTDGDGIGVYFNYSACGAEDHSVYETGIALMAIVENGAKDSVVHVSGSPVDGWTYYDVAVDAMNWLAFAQNDAGNERGGWGYYANYVGRSDNSISGYAALGIAYASSAPPEGFSIPVPPFVLTELGIWTGFIQCPTAGTDLGGSGYDSPCNWVNCLKTGNLLFQQSLIGQNLPGVPVQNAITYLINHWNDPNADPGWQNHGQAMYTIMKGLEFQGIGQYLNPPANTIDWYDALTDNLVTYQNVDGSWGPDQWGDQNITTAWCLLTLEKAAPPPPTGTIPTLSEWGAIIFGTLLLASVAFYVWRRRRTAVA